jgi:hypothetical protein
MIWIFPRSKVSKIGKLRRYQATKKRRENLKRARSVFACENGTPFERF